MHRTNCEVVPKQVRRPASSEEGDECWDVPKEICEERVVEVPKRIPRFSWVTICKTKKTKISKAHPHREPAYYSEEEDEEGGGGEEEEETEEEEDDEEKDKGYFMEDYYHDY